MNKNLNSKENLTEMQQKQKKNQMLNYFVDRRKKKKPSAMQKAKQKALNKLQKDENCEWEESEESSGDNKISE